MEAFYSTSLLGVPTYVILWSFLVYAFLGVLVEMVFCLMTEAVLESRTGLLYLPLRPLYGVGGVACTVLLHPFAGQWLLVFLGSFVVLSVVELVASYAMDAASATVCWDYRHKLLSVQGRICLEYSLYWGALGLLVVYALDPFLSGLLATTRSEVSESLLTALLALTLLSTALTLAAITRIRRRVRTPDPLSRGVEDSTVLALWERLIDRVVPDPVMINTFPRMSLLTEFEERIGRSRAWIRVPDPLVHLLTVHQRLTGGDDPVAPFDQHLSSAGAWGPDQPPSEERWAVLRETA